jgi:hypothetical protein
MANDNQIPKHWLEIAKRINSIAQTGLISRKTIPL